MPSPEVLALIADFRRRLMMLDAGTAAAMVAAYGPIWTRLSGELDTLLLQVQNQQLSFSQVARIQRYHDLLLDVRRRVDIFAKAAEGQITTAQRAAVGLAEAGAKGVVDAALPPGINMGLLSQVGIEWVRMPAEAFETFIGFSGDGSPLERLLRPLGAEASVGVREGIKDGIALGYGPRETAALVRQRFGMPLTRALTISRTETLRAFRESSRLQYAANPNIVKKWRRISARDDRVCEACLALDGQEQDTNEAMAVHPNDRCAVSPVTISYRDLGLDVDIPEMDESTSRDWFEAQPESTQRAMLGKGKFEAWQAGQFKLTDMAKVKVDPVWGPTASVKPLKELVSA